MCVAGVGICFPRVPRTSLFQHAISIPDKRFTRKKKISTEQQLSSFQGNLHLHSLCYHAEPVPRNLALTVTTAYTKGTQARCRQGNEDSAVWGGVRD